MEMHSASWHSRGRNSRKGPMIGRGELSASHAVSEDHHQSGVMVVFIVQATVGVRKK